MTKKKGALAGNEINMPKVPQEGDPLFKDMMDWLMSLPDVDPLVPPDFKEAPLENSPIVLMAHPKSRCKGHPCALHHRTKHKMRSWMQHWRSDRQFMERICEHGVGHPDPDQWDYLVMKYGKGRAKAEFTHGCCGCCRIDKDAQDLRAK